MRFCAPLFLALAASAAAAPAPLRFDHAPLGNAVRVIAARLGATVSVAANATAPVSGDFSSLAPAAALAEAARQAGLVVRPVGPASARTFLLAKPEAAPAVSAPSSSDQERQRLLRERAALLAEEARLR